MTKIAKFYYGSLMVYFAFSILLSCLNLWRILGFASATAICLAGLGQVFRCWAFVGILKRSMLWLVVYGTLACLSFLSAPVLWFIHANRAATNVPIFPNSLGFWLSELMMVACAVCCFGLRYEIKKTQSERSGSTAITPSPLTRLSPSITHF